MICRCSHTVSTSGFLVAWRGENFLTKSACHRFLTFKSRDGTQKAFFCSFRSPSLLHYWAFFGNFSERVAACATAGRGAREVGVNGQLWWLLGAAE